MASQIVAYRLTDEEIELLSKFRINDEESINLIAQRLLRESIGLSTPLPNAEYKTPLDELRLQFEELKSQISELSAKLPA